MKHLKPAILFIVLLTITGCSNSKNQAVYDDTAGNIYVKQTGDTSLEVAVNINEGMGVVDTIILNNDESEISHNVQVTDPVRGEDQYGESYLAMSKSTEYLTFDIKVDPTKYNYITVKYWGGDVGSNSAMILMGENSFLRNQDYGSEWPLLDYLNNEPMQDGTYYYSTYRLPINMTMGKEKVTLQLRHYGDVDAYDLNKDGIKYVEVDKESRPVYLITSHTNSSYEIQPEEAIGQRVALNKDTSFKDRSGDTAYDYILNKVNEFTYKVIEWQIYGEEFEKNVRDGKTLEITRGALLANGSPTRSYGSLDDFADHFYSSLMGGNAEYIKYLYPMAIAYTIPSNDYFQSDELLDRMCAAWDFYVRAQGSNGGFNNEVVKWVGISDKRENGYASDGRTAAGAIIAAGEKSIAETFILLYDYIDEKGYLDEYVDYNLDGKIDKATERRRDAYYNMFIEGAEYGFEYNHRECVNQDLLNLTMGYFFNKAAALLGEAPVDEEYVNTRLHGGLGIIEHTYTLPDGTIFDHGGYQFSQKGALGLETFGSAAGGYCGNYGFNCASLLYDFAYITKDQKLIDQALKASDGLSYFFDNVMSNSNVAVLRKEDGINTRNLFMPGRIAFAGGGENFLPIALGSESSLRQFELFLNSGYFYTESFPSGSSHTPDVIRHYIDMVTVDEIANVLKAASDGNKENKSSEHIYDLNTDYLLPFEEEHENFVWTDELARVVVIKNDDEKLRMTLNWRLDYNGPRKFVNASVNNVARVHHTTSEAAYVSTFNMKSPYGFGGVYIAKYGDYTIIMNSSLDEQYTTTLIGNGEGISKNLVTGELITFNEAIALQPQSTLVIYTSEDGTVKREPSEIVNIIEEDKNVIDESPVELLTSGTHEIYPEIDTYVKSTDVTNVYSNDINLILGKDREGLLMFDLRSIPDNILDITLRTYSWWGPSNELIFSLVPDYTNLGEKVNYLNAPIVDEELGKFILRSNSNKDAQTNLELALVSKVDLTEIIKDYRSKYPEATRIVLHIANKDVTNCTEIRSSENKDGIEYGPTLVVTVP